MTSARWSQNTRETRCVGGYHHVEGREPEKPSMDARCACGEVAPDGKECAECYWARIERELDARL